MSDRTRNTFLAIVAVLLVAIVAYGGFNGWFVGPAGPQGSVGARGLQGRPGPQGEALIVEVTSEPLLTEEVAVEADSLDLAGQMAWHQDTNMDGWEASPVGDLDGTLYLLVEIWGPTSDGNRGFVVVVPPGAVAWFQYHYGGTAWWLAADADIETIVSEHVAAILARDGQEPIVVYLPNDGFSLLGCLQTMPVENGVRHCDAVGGFPGYDVPAALPAPGYFPGYDQ